MTKLFSCLCAWFGGVSVNVSFHTRRVDSSLAICTEWKWPTWFSNCFVCVCVCLPCERSPPLHAQKIPSARAHHRRWLNYSHVNYLVYRFYYRRERGRKGKWRDQQKLYKWKLRIPFRTYYSRGELKVISGHVMCTSCIENTDWQVREHTQTHLCVCCGR